MNFMNFMTRTRDAHRAVQEFLQIMNLSRSSVIKKRHDIQPYRSRTSLTMLSTVLTEKRNEKVTRSQGDLRIPRMKSQRQVPGNSAKFYELKRVLFKEWKHYRIIDPRAPQILHRFDGSRKSSPIAKFGLRGPEGRVIATVQCSQFGLTTSKLTNMIS